MILAYVSVPFLDTAKKNWCETIVKTRNSLIDGLVKEIRLCLKCTHISIPKQRPVTGLGVRKHVQSSCPVSENIGIMSIVGLKADTIPHLKIMMSGMKMMMNAFITVVDI